MLLRIITSRIKINSAKMQLIRNFLMQDLLWLPLSISKTGTTLGEDCPQEWRWLQLWQESGPTCPAGDASICSIVPDQTQLSDASSLRKLWLALKYSNWIRLVLINFNITVHVNLIFLCHKININHYKSLIFLWFL